MHQEVEMCVIGKKVINLCNHSGIIDESCVRMYLEDYWSFPGGFQLPVIYGRRRVGKTALIRRFIQGKEAIFFTAIESSEQQNLENLSRAILAAAGSDASPVFQNFHDAFEYVFRKSLKKPLVLAVDEYPYLAKACPAVSSILQKLIDEYKDQSQLFLILCGSSMSFMEEQVLGYQSPLYGRRTAQLKILPFDFFEAREYFRHFSALDMAAVYGIVGGTPQYLLQMDDSLSLEENLKEHLLDPACYLFEEPGNLLKQEIREASSYNAVISAIAGGASRLSEIADKTGLESSACSGHLNKLMALGLIRKEAPFGQHSTRKTIYAVADPLFRFWYRFIPKYISLLQNGMVDPVCDRIMAQLPQYMGPVFEDICKQWLWRQNRCGTLPFFFTSLGRWWGSDPRTKSEAEIDIVATGDEEDTLFCECKWTQEAVDSGILTTLVTRSELIRSGRRHYMLFSRSGFTDGCRAKAEEMGNVRLMDFTAMLGEKIFFATEDATEPAGIFGD